MMFPAQDQRDVGLSAAKELAYFGLRHCPSQLPDRSHFICGQKFLETCDSADVDGVLPVLLIVDPFEIGDGVMMFDAINMIDHWEIVRVGNECESDDAMNEHRFGFPIFRQSHIEVSGLGMGFWTENLAVAEPWLPAVAPSVQASDATEITDFVNVFKTGDRNRSPFFCGSGIHTAGCPSGEIRLAIKDPLFVATFGGSAHYGAASRYLQ